MSNVGLGFNLSTKNLSLNDSENKQSFRNLKSPRVNGDPLIESARKLADMNVVKADYISRASSNQRSYRFSEQGNPQNVGIMINNYN